MSVPRLLLGLILSATLARAAAAAPTISVGSASGAPGATVSLPITFNADTGSVASFQFSLTLPVSVSTVTATAGTIVTAAAKTMASPSLIGRKWTFVVYGMRNPSGSGVAANVQLKIASNAPAGSISIPISDVVFASPDALNVSTGANVNGAITVTGASPQPPAPPKNLRFSERPEGAVEQENKGSKEVITVALR